MNQTKIFEGENMTDEMLKWLRFAIELEDKGLKFYRKCLAETHHARAMELFDFLVKAETGHKRVLTHIFEAYSKGDNKKIQESVEAFMQIDELKIPLFKKEDREKITGPYTQLTHMFNTAMEMEDRGIELYDDLAEKEKDPKLKKLFIKLSADEVLHKKEIRDIGYFVFGVGPPDEVE